MFSLCKQNPSRHYGLGVAGHEFGQKRHTRFRDGHMTRHVDVRLPFVLLVHVLFNGVTVSYVPMR